MNKDYEDAYALIQGMMHNHYPWGSEHVPIEKASQNEEYIKLVSLTILTLK